MNDMTADDVLAALASDVPETAPVESAPVAETVTDKPKRTRATAHEVAMRYSVEALSVAIGMPVDVARNTSDVRYMRALFDLNVDGEALAVALTVNEIALLAAFATRSAEIVALRETVELAVAA